MKTVSEKAKSFIDDMSFVVPDDKRDEFEMMLAKLLKDQDKDTRKACSAEVRKLRTLNDQEDSLLRAASIACLSV